MVPDPNLTKAQNKDRLAQVRKEIKLEREAFNRTTLALERVIRRRRARTSQLAALIAERAALTG